jgi:hypothetical protein
VSQYIIVTFNVANPTIIKKHLLLFSLLKMMKEIEKIFMDMTNIGGSFKFLLKAGVEESIVNAPLISLQSKNTNNAKSEVRFKQLICDLQSLVRSQSTLQHQLSEEI